MGMPCASTQAVVKFHAKVENGLPTRSRMAVVPPVNCRRYCVAGSNEALGVRTHLPVAADQFTVAGTGAPVANTFRVNVVVDIPIMVSVKPMSSVVDTGTPTAFVETFREDIIGAKPVRKRHWIVENGLPARSRMAETPPTALTVYHVSSARFAVG